MRNFPKTQKISNAIAFNFQIFLENYKLTFWAFIPGFVFLWIWVCCKSLAVTWPTMTRFWALRFWLINNLCAPPAPSECIAKLLLKNHFCWNLGKLVTNAPPTNFVTWMTWRNKNNFSLRSKQLSFVRIRHLPGAQLTSRARAGEAVCSDF